MGNVSSSPQEGAALYLRDQTRLSISSLNITNSRNRVLLHIAPNAHPATRVTASRESGDYSNVEYVQDTDPLQTAASPAFLLKLNNDDELIFTFSFILRKTQGDLSNGSTDNTQADTLINGLTFVSASSLRDVDNLVTREFSADPNIHRNPNVNVVGDGKFSTGGSQAVSFDWSWKWKPPKPAEDRGGGWRNTCSFVEYDQRAHRLDTLASFSFWVANTHISPPSIGFPSPTLEVTLPPRLRVPSSQSVDSRISGADSGKDEEEGSPITTIPESGFPLNLSSTRDTSVSMNTMNTMKTVDVSCSRPGEDMSSTEDGPLFRATMKALEQKTGNMRARMKKVLKKAEAAHVAQTECNEAFSNFMNALREASSSNANAVQPALEHYFDKIAREILLYEQQNATNLQKIIIDPLTKLYTIDIKQAESKKRDFEEESKDYYAYLSRYLGQRQDSLKEKKRIESDSKYQTKRRNFELKRFDYSSFMQDLHGGRKEQEVLSYLTRYAGAQTRGYLDTAKKVEGMLPQLDALSSEVEQANKDFQNQRTEREGKRRTLELSTKTYIEPDSIPQVPLMPPLVTPNGFSGGVSEFGLHRADTGATSLRAASGNGSIFTPGSSGGPVSPVSEYPRSSGGIPNAPSIGSPGNAAKFRGIRDLEEKDYTTITSSEKNNTQRKEGLLWALSRPGSHADPKGLNKQAWHKFWIVLDQGKLSEYSNWKQRLDLHMEPIDLRMASVREARNAERRFCFEVITPQYKRVYQATSEEDMNNWISSINNALQSAVEGRGLMAAVPDSAPAPAETTGSSLRRDIGSILTGKSSLSHHNSSAASTSSNANSQSVFRRTTVGARPPYQRANSQTYDAEPDKLLHLLRDTDQGNCWCADCGSGIKTEWVSINIGIILCIECSGIHRSLGTHISKVRSLTLDIKSFTTDIVDLLLLVGNRVSNMVWEARLDQTTKPSPQATREQRLKFITAKYVDKAYIEPISSASSRFATPDDTLLAAVKKNDIQQVIYALALKANPNVTDKSRGTHVVFLALAAADPASPNSTTTSSSHSRTESTSVKPFPVAELLVQNGADIPSTLPAFPLSRGATLYIDQKAGRATTSSSNGSGDTLGALPTVSLDKARDRETRLQKRVSAGGRLAKAPILER